MLFEGFFAGQANLLHRSVGSLETGIDNDAPEDLTNSTLGAISLSTGTRILPFAIDGVDEFASVTTCASLQHGQTLGFPPIEITGLSKQPSISC